MEPLAFAGPRNPASVGGAPGVGVKGLAWIGGALASLAAIGVAAVLAIVFAATLVVIGLMATALVVLGGWAYRAHRTFKAAEPSDPEILEARHVGGHSWIAYGWDRRGR